MNKASFISPKGAWHAKPADTIVLASDERRGRHVDLKATNGLEFTMDLPIDVMLRGGDALVLDDGRLVEVVSAPEELAEIRVAEPRDLARIAYHLGNGHTPVQILANRIRVRADREIEDIARGLGAKIAHIEAPFDPEGGAYASSDVEEGHVHGPDCGHDHHDHHGHDHHGHEHHAHENHDHGHAHDDHKHGDHHDHGKHGHDDHHGHKHG